MHVKRTGSCELAVGVSRSAATPATLGAVIENSYLMDELSEDFTGRTETHVICWKIPVGCCRNIGVSANVILTMGDRCSSNRALVPCGSCLCVSASLSVGSVSVLLRGGKECRQPLEKGARSIVAVV